VEPKELSPEVAGKILDADFQNVVKKVAAGKPLTVAERSRIESLAAGSNESLAYAKTLVELSAVLGVTRRTLTTWQKMEGSPKPLSNGLWPVADWREFVRIRGLKAGKVPLGNDEALKARKLLTEGMVRRLAGFNLHETNTIPPDHAEKLVGFAAHASAVAVAMRYLQPVADYQQAGAVTDPQTGMTFGYLRFTDTRANKIFVTIECLYGFVAAKTDALKRIVKP
jgi:hypothetical protein